MKESKIFISTTSKHCRVAILFNNLNKDDEMNVQFCENLGERNHSVTLLKLIDKCINEINKENKFSFEEIKEIIVDVGPGSFTGIRIGISTVKGLAFMKDIMVKEISSLEILQVEYMSLYGRFLEKRGIDKKRKLDEHTFYLIDAKNMQMYLRYFNRDIKKMEDLSTDYNNFIEILSNYEPFDRTKTITIVTREKEEVENNLQTLLEENEIDKELFERIRIEDIEEEYSKLGNIWTSFVYENIFDYSKNLDSKNSNEILPNYLKKSQAQRMKEASK